MQISFDSLRITSKSHTNKTNEKRNKIYIYMGESSTHRTEWYWSKISDTESPDWFECIYCIQNMPNVMANKRICILRITKTTTEKNHESSWTKVKLRTKIRMDDASFRMENNRASRFLPYFCSSYFVRQTVGVAHNKWRLYRIEWIFYTKSIWINRFEHPLLAMLSINY